MLIEINLANSYLIKTNIKIWELYNKLYSNPQKTLIVIDSSYRLFGSITPGDITRFESNYSQGNFSSSIFDSEAQDLAFRNTVYLNENNLQNDIKTINSKLHRVLPIVNDKKQLKSIYVPELSNKKFNKIGKFEVSQTSRPILIAEIGVNHNGDIDTAKSLIENSKKAGADIVKFQYRDLESVYINSALSGSSDLSVEYTVDHLKKSNLSFSNIKELFDYARKINIEPICTAFDLISLEKIKTLDPICYKIASCDIDNYPLLNEVRKLKKPVIFSTGMSNQNEIIKCHNFLSSGGVFTLPLHCVSAYPAPLDHLNLRFIQHLSKILGSNVGYSSHDIGINASLTAVTLGASLIEKHITFDKNAIGPDHKASLEPDEFSKLANGIREVWTSLQGNGRTRKITQIEQLNKHNLGKGLYAISDIAKNESLISSKFKVLSPGGGVSPMLLSNINQYVATQPIKKGDLLFQTSIKNKTKLDKISGGNKKLINNENYLWGIPVRYRDYKNIIKNTNPKLVEFHLTYRDLEFNPTNLDTRVLENIKVSFHSPECFEKDHIVDLVSCDDAYLDESLEKIKGVIDHITKVDKYLNQDSYDLIINIGGFNRDGFFEKHYCRDTLYPRLKNSLKLINTRKCNLCIQTMPPFPWHLGGRSHHNLFVDPEEIIELSKYTNQKICIDISHTYMACEFLKLDFYESIDKLLEVSNYLHLSDASSVDEEGLNIGDGKINFEKLNSILLSKNKRIEFITEIWEGHLNNGYFFKNSLQELTDLGW